MHKDIYCCSNPWEKRAPPHTHTTPTKVRTSDFRIIVPTLCQLRYRPGLIRNETCYFLSFLMPWHCQPFWLSKIAQVQTKPFPNISPQVGLKGDAEWTPTWNCQGKYNYAASTRVRTFDHKSSNQIREALHCYVISNNIHVILNKLLPRHRVRNRTKKQQQTRQLYSYLTPPMATCLSKTSNVFTQSTSWIRN